MQSGIPERVIIKIRNLDKANIDRPNLIGVIISHCLTISVRLNKVGLL